MEREPLSCDLGSPRSKKQKSCLEHITGRSPTEVGLTRRTTPFLRIVPLTWKWVESAGQGLNLRSPTEHSGISRRLHPLAQPAPENLGAVGHPRPRRKSPKSNGCPPMPRFLENRRLRHLSPKARQTSPCCVGRQNLPSVRGLPLRRKDACDPAGHRRGKGVTLAGTLPPPSADAGSYRTPFLCTLLFLEERWSDAARSFFIKATGLTRSPSHHDLINTL